jgi:NAD-dependent SIR2 family protein deacetylase
MTPAFDSALEFGLEHAKDLLQGKKTLVLTGAGISTSSGIPDYRGAGRVQKHPLTFDEFMGSGQNQARYWARSYVGWHRIASATPNLGHQALCEAEQNGHVFHIITQNVDGLHQKAGSQNVVELHGRLDRVLCTGCGDILARSELDGRIFSLNPDFRVTEVIEFSPDGDAEIETPRNFKVPNCGICGSHYKPDVVFFGEQVPLSRVQFAEQLVSSAEAIVVAGSSLTVNSGLRLVKQAKKFEIPIVILNLGETRADAIADVKLNGSTTELMKELFS